MFAFMARLGRPKPISARTRGIITLDGLRVEFPHGLGLVRLQHHASLTLRFEADDPIAMADIRDRFRRQLLALQADLALPSGFPFPIVSRG